jgi:hypothetical protein
MHVSTVRLLRFTQDKPQRVYVTDGLRLGEVKEDESLPADSRRLESCKRAVKIFFKQGNKKRAIIT